MESSKQKPPKKARFYKKRQEPEKSDLKAKLRTIRDKLGQLETKEFWHSHLPWPRFLRKPKIRFEAPRINRTIPIPNRTIMFCLSLILVCFSIAGGAYDMVSKSVGKIAIGYDTSVTPPRPIFFYGGMNDQFMLEGIIAFALIICGFIGFLFIHQSTKHFYRPKYSYMLFAVGIVLLLFAVFSLQSILIHGKGTHLYSSSF
jgi:hypothetical protein